MNRLGARGTMMYVGIENGVASWTAVYLERTTALDQAAELTSCEMN